MQAYALTDIGRRRHINQDYIYASTKAVGAFPNLFILADGMGGHRAGDFASRYLVETLVGYVSKNTVDEPVKVMNNAIMLSNAMIYHKSLEDEELMGMGSTLVAAVIEKDLLTVANVGDSRLYLVRDDIIQITKDHSYVQEMIDKGLMKKGSEEYLSKKKYITRAVGSEEEVRADYFEVELEDGDYILLCSDGLTNMVDDDRRLSVISGNGSIEYKVRTLIADANRNGGMDNIAVILIRYTEGGEEDD